MDATVAQRLRAQRCGRCAHAGARIEEIALRRTRRPGAIKATGGFSAAESYAWHRQLLERSGAGYDPRVAHAHRARRGHEGATSTSTCMHARARLDRRAWKRALRAFDAVLSPTVPIVAPPIADVAPGDGARRRVLPRQRAAAAQHQRRQHARRLRDLDALPRAGRTAGRPDALAWRAARRRAARTIALQVEARAAVRLAQALTLHRKASNENRDRGRRHHRRHHRLRAGRRRPRGDRVRAPRRRRRGNQLRQRRRGRARLRHALGRARHAGQGAALPVQPRTRRSSCAGRCRAREIALDVAAGSAPASSRPTWPTARGCSGWPSTAATRLHADHRGPAARVRPQRRLPGAAALRARTASWCSPGLQVLRDAGVQLPRDRCRRGPHDRAGAQPRHAVRRRDPPAGRRSRQLPAVRAAAQVRGAGAGRAVSTSTATVAPLDARARRTELHRWPSGAAQRTLRRRRGVRRRRFGRAAAPAGPAHSAGAGLRLFDQRATSANRSTRRAAR